MSDELRAALINAATAKAAITAASYDAENADRASRGCSPVYTAEYYAEAVEILDAEVARVTSLGDDQCER